LGTLYGGIGPDKFTQVNFNISLDIATDCIFDSVQLKYQADEKNIVIITLFNII